MTQKDTIRPADAFQEAFCPACIKADVIDEIADKVGKIYSAIYEGNGTPSIMTRIAMLEQRLATTNSGLLVVLRDVALPAAMLIGGMVLGKVIK